LLEEYINSRIAQVTTSVSDLGNQIRKVGINIKTATENMENTVMGQVEKVVQNTLKNELKVVQSNIRDNNTKFKTQEKKMDDLWKKTAEMLQLLTSNNLQQVVSQSDNIKMETTTQSHEIATINDTQKQKKKA
jgi:hypothetical protein